MEKKEDANEKNIINGNGDAGIVEYESFSGIVQCGSTDCEVKDASFVIDHKNNTILEFNEGRVLSGNMTVVQWSNGVFEGDELNVHTLFNGFIKGNKLTCHKFLGGVACNCDVECTLWENGTFSGKSFNGTWNNGYFKKGEFNGTWNDGLFINGTFSGTWNGGERREGIWNSTSEEPPITPFQDINICKKCKCFKQVNDPDTHDNKWHWGVGCYCSCHSKYSPWSKQYKKAVSEEEFKHAFIYLTSTDYQCPQHKERYEVNRK